METAVVNQTRLISRAKPMKSKSTCKLEKHNTAAYPKGYTIDEIQEMMYEKLSTHYGVDVRTL